MKCMIRVILTVLFALQFLEGCVPVGPAFVQPDPGFSIPDTYRTVPVSSDNENPQGAAGLFGDTAWWHAFNDRSLNRLVDEVLENNRDIQKAAARILEVRSQLTAARAGRYPSIILQGDAKVQKSTVTTIAPSFEQGRFALGSVSERKTVETYSLALPASYEVDLWGRFTQAETAAEANLLQTEETRHAVAQSAVAEAASLYFQLAAMQQRIRISEKRIRTYRKSLSLVEGRYERGLTSILDVRQARRALAQASAELPDLTNSLGKIRFGLSVMTGTYPGAEAFSPAIELDAGRLSPVPAGLPSELLARRPDIRGAEARLRSLTAQVGEAAANRLPRLTLTGTMGTVSDDFSRLFRPEAELWRLASGLAAPIFNAGKLKANQDAAEARLAQSLADYSKTVLNAFSEVESALLTREKQMLRREKLASFLSEAKATQEIAENRYLTGLVDYLRVLEAQQTRFAAEQNMVLVDLAIFTNRVALHRALGGGWGKEGQGPRPVEEKIENRFANSPQTASTISAGRNAK